MPQDEQLSTDTLFSPPLDEAQRELFYFMGIAFHPIKTFNDVKVVVERAEKSGYHVFDFGAGSVTQTPAEIQKIFNRYDSLLQQIDHEPYLESNDRIQGLGELLSSFAFFLNEEFGLDLGIENQDNPERYLHEKDEILRNHICFGTGSRELVTLALESFDSGTLVLYPDFGFQTIEESANPNLIYKTFPITKENGNKPDITQLGQIINQFKEANPNKDVVLFINYPHNPTGAVLTKADREQLMSLNVRYIINDDPYATFQYRDRSTESSFPIIEEIRSKYVENCSGTKIFQLGANKASVFIGPADFIESISILKRKKNQFVPLLTQFVLARAFMMSRALISEQRKQLKVCRDAMHNFVLKLGLDATIPEAGLFMWVKIPPELGLSSSEFTKLLASYGIIVVPGEAFNREGFVRLCFQQPLDMILMATDSIPQELISFITRAKTDTINPNTQIAVS